ncbi:MAG: flagellin [bacterium]
MRIMHNISAIFAQRHLRITNEMINENIEKLSSGYRINRAADDAAGLAVSEKFRSQINGLDQGLRNTMDGISVVQTAEAGLEEVHKMLQRMRVLSVQVANGSYTDDDRSMVQVEVDQILDEIDRMAESVQFNTLKLFTGNFSKDSPYPLTQNASQREVVKGTARIDLNARFSTAGFDGGTPNGAIIVNGVTFSLADYSSVREFIEAVNASQEAGVTLEYDKSADKFIFQSKEIEENLTLIEKPVTEGHGFLTMAKIESGTTPAIFDHAATAITRYQAALAGTDADYITNNNIIDITKPFSSAGFDLSVTGTVTVNGEKFSIAKYSSVLQFMKAINESERADATIRYDAETDQFTIRTDTPGQDLRLEETTSAGTADEVGFFTAVGIQPLLYLAPSLTAAKTSTERVKLDGTYVDVDKGFAADNFRGKDIGGVAIINGQIFSIADYKTVQEFIDEVNRNEAADVTMTYDKSTDQFIIRRDTPGENLRLAEVASSAGSTFFKEINMAIGTTKPAVPDGFEEWQGSLVLHVGANKNETFSVHIQTMTTAGLKIDMLKELGLTTRERAESAIKKFQKAIDQVSVLRSNLGAYQNRLEHTLNFVEIAHEEMTASEARIRDLDMASETSLFTRNQILAQAGTAMLAQANLMPQSVLQLLS